MPTKVHLVKSMVFPVVIYGWESWTIKKAEHWRIDAFELWCWRRLLRVPWTARRSYQSILNETSPGCSLEGMMLRLKLQYFGHLMRRVDSLEKTHAGRDWGHEEKGTTEDEMAGWASPTRWTWVWVNRSWWWTGRPGVLRFMWLQRGGHDWATEMNWTEQCMPDTWTNLHDWTCERMFTSLKAWNLKVRMQGTYCNKNARLLVPGFWRMPQRIR